MNKKLTTKLTTQAIVQMLVEEISASDSFSAPNPMNELTVIIGKSGWNRIVQIAHVLKTH